MNFYSCLYHIINRFTSQHLLRYDVYDSDIYISVKRSLKIDTNFKLVFITVAERIPSAVANLAKSVSWNSARATVVNAPNAKQGAGQERIGITTEKAINVVRPRAEPCNPACINSQGYYKEGRSVIIQPEI